MTPIEKFAPVLDRVAGAIWNSEAPAIPWSDLKELAESGEELGAQLTLNTVRHQAFVAMTAAIEALAHEGVARRTLRMTGARAAGKLWPRCG